MIEKSQQKRQIYRRFFNVFCSSIFTTFPYAKCQIIHSSNKETSFCAHLDVVQSIAWRVAGGHGGVAMQHVRRMGNKQEQERSPEIPHAMEILVEVWPWINLVQVLAVQKIVFSPRGHHGENATRLLVRLFVYLACCITLLSDIY